MLKANMKLPMWLVVIATLITILLTIHGLNLIHIIVIPACVFLIIYFSVGFVKRKDALIICDNTITVKTPFRTRKYEISKIKKVYIADNDSTIKGIYLEDNSETEVTILSNIYNVDIHNIVGYLLDNYPQLRK